MNWYRVELTEQGDVLSVSVVEKSELNDRRVVYVHAESIAEAGKEAYNEYQRIITKERRARYEAEGRCRCGRERDDPEKKQCAVCREKGGRDDARYRERKRNGEEGHTRDEEQRVAAFQERNRDRRGEIRLETLLEVRTMLNVNPDLTSFADWLRVEIDKLAGEDPRQKGGDSGD